ncbi:WecB/TagA/CpsF family glycosyltransferase [Desulfococcaceae bacterium HSG8]|nr:WecB/TagA/CpsF family glycosyltransferase [Desulfococcaceae bacterium HSG8]
MSRDTKLILGLPIDNVTMDQAVQRIFDLIDRYEKYKQPRLVVTVHIDFVVQAISWWPKCRLRHPEFLDIIKRAALVTADGMPIVWAGRLLGTPLKGRVTGADLVPRLAEAAAEHGKSIYFLGGHEGVGEKAAEILKQRHPNLEIAGIDAPYVHIEGETSSLIQEDKPIVDRINDSGTHILLIAFGCPKQELWFERNKHRLNVPISIGVGGTFEFIAGTIARAPVWMQKYGAEWIFRVSQEPERLWKRYFFGFLKFSIIFMRSFFNSQVIYE